MSSRMAQVLEYGAKLSAELEAVQKERDTLRKQLAERDEKLGAMHPTYDEAKERELFEASLGSTLASLNSKGDYVYVSSRDKWEGWKACAQSRAKAGEVGHE